MEWISTQHPWYVKCSPIIAELPLLWHHTCPFYNYVHLILTLCRPRLPAASRAEDIQKLVQWPVFPGTGWQRDCSKEGTGPWEDDPSFDWLGETFRRVILPLMIGPGELACWSIWGRGVLYLRNSRMDYIGGHQKDYAPIADRLWGTFLLIGWRLGGTVFIE